MIRYQLAIVSGLLLICIVIPALFPSNWMIFTSVTVWSVALVYFVIQVLKDQEPGFENKEDQITPP